MTSKELHNQKIIPLRMELKKLEDEYRELYRKECGDKIGEKATCNNCAFSCVLNIIDHNYCMGGKCTCCYDWCYSWMPENEVSKFLRNNYHCDASKFHVLEDIFGDDFLEECNNPEHLAMVMEMLELVAKFEEKAGGQE